MPAYSLTAAIPPGGWYDAVLGGIFNFTPEPTWAQVDRMARLRDRDGVAVPAAAEPPAAPATAAAPAAPAATTAHAH